MPPCPSFIYLMDFINHLLIWSAGRVLHVLGRCSVIKLVSVPHLSSGAVLVYQLNCHTVWFFQHPRPSKLENQRTLPSTSKEFMSQKRNPRVKGKATTSSSPAPNSFPSLRQPLLPGPNPRKPYRSWRQLFRSFRWKDLENFGQKPEVWWE